MKTETVQLNNQDYEIRIVVSNRETDMLIPTGIISSLIINDSIYAPFHSAILTINNTGNAIDNYVALQNDKPTSFAFNVDSADKFFITIKPKGDFKEDIWGFNHGGTDMAGGFTIYDEEEVLDNRGIVKSKTFFLRSQHEHLLECRYDGFSTATSSNVNFNASHVTNKAREMYTGDAISSLLGYSTGLWQSSKWDRGATKVFHTSGPGESAYDTLEHMLDKHISSANKDFCIFTQERNGDMSLESMTDIYKKAYREDKTLFGEYFIDAFSSSSGTLDPSVDGVTRIVPSKVYGFTEREANELEGLVNFSYLNTSADDSMKELVTTIGHSYNKSDKQFNIDAKDNHIYSIKKKFQHLYTDNMKGEPQARTILPLNMEKLGNEAVKHVYTGGSSKVERSAGTINSVLRKIFAFAPSISFDTPGASARRSGRFIILNANYANSNSPFAKVFVGEWLTTKVTHVFLFTKNSYLNTVTCVKPFTNKELVPGRDEGNENMFNSSMEIDNNA